MRTRGWERATQAVCRAIKAGELPPITEQTACVDCGDPAKQYDHRDYNQPLVVDSVCNECNQKRGPAIPWDGKSPPRRRKKIIHDEMNGHENETVRLAKDTTLPIDAICKAAKIKRRWFYRFRAGDFEEPGINKVMRLHKILKDHQAKNGHAQ